MLLKGTILFLATLLLLAANSLTLRIRTTTQPWKNAAWTPIALTESIDPQHTALIICDMWDKHWCRGATGRVGVLAPQIAATAAALRNAGALIIHSPSDTMDFYSASPQRKAMLAIPHVNPPDPIELKDPPLPIDDSGGGCDTNDTFYKAWTREHPAIAIAPADLISDNGSEVYSALKARDIRHVLIAGVHTNMCVLNRTFAIKQLTRWGVRCILLRDLTDSMYNPADRPHVTHDGGTALVIEHIEKYWCPTMLSGDLLRTLASK